MRILNWLDKGLGVLTGIVTGAISGLIFGAAYRFDGNPHCLKRLFSAEIALLSLCDILVLRMIYAYTKR